MTEKSKARVVSAHAEEARTWWREIAARAEKLTDDFGLLCGTAVLIVKSLEIPSNSVLAQEKMSAYLRKNLLNVSAPANDREARQQINAKLAVLIKFIDQLFLANLDLDQAKQCTKLLTEEVLFFSQIISTSA